MKYLTQHLETLEFQNWTPHRNPRYASNGISVPFFVDENHNQCSTWQKPINIPKSFQNSVATVKFSFKRPMRHNAGMIIEEARTSTGHGAMPVTCFTLPPSDEAASSTTTASSAIVLCQRPHRPSHPRSPPPWSAALPSSPAPWPLRPVKLLALLRVPAP